MATIRQRFEELLETPDGMLDSSNGVKLRAVVTYSPFATGEAKVRYLRDDLILGLADELDDELDVVSPDEE